jgi:uncharacterized protein (DUF608 family)
LRCFSAYCGGLHIAALRACVEMARIMNDTQAVDEYQVWLNLAKKSYSEKLWNGEFSVSFLKLHILFR